MFQDEEEEIEQKKKLLLSLNGDINSPIVTMEYSEITNFDIKRKIEQSYGVEFKLMRLFTTQGVEMFEEDLMFLKSGTLLYVSDGRDFDAYSQINMYQILKSLGEGGFGRVLLGKHKFSKELVAIKIIDAVRLWNAADIDLVFREAEVMKSLRHQNIVKIYNCYTLPTMQVVLIMEYLEGGDLVEYIKNNGRMSEEQARLLFTQIADAICYCHDQKLVHRDLKLENILLTSQKEKQIKIIDFGIATVAINFKIDKTDIGSLSYMPPEILLQKVDQIKPSIDVWALGVILYALVCGTLPFKEPLYQNITTCNYQFPNLQLSKEYKELIIGMLNPDPNLRISSYQVLEHSWMKKQNSQTLQTPLRLKGIQKRKQSMQQSAVLIRNALGSGLGFESPLQIIKKLPTLMQQSTILQSTILKPSITITQFSKEPEEQQQIISPKETTNRKYSQLNKKLLEKFFQEDLKPKTKQYQKQQNSTKQKIGSSTSINCSKIPKTATQTVLNSPISLERQQQQQYYCHKKQQSLDSLKNKQLKLRTIINLSGLTELKLQYKDEFKQKNKNSQILITEQTNYEEMYKIQTSFRHRKQRSDELLHRVLRCNKLKISDLYGSLFKK